MNQINLGQLIDLLNQRPQNQGVSFDFCGTVPDSVDSYRGYYDQLAVGWCHGGKPQTVAGLLAILEGAVGTTYEGWKGGEYVMSRRTPLWVSNPGECGQTIITGLAGDVHTVIETRWLPW